MSTHCYRHSFREIHVKTTCLEDFDPWGPQEVGKQTQRHLRVQSAEWRYNLSSKVSRLFLPLLFPAVRAVLLSFKKKKDGWRNKKVSECTVSPDSKQYSKGPAAPLPHWWGYTRSSVLQNTASGFKHCSQTRSFQKTDIWENGLEELPARSTALEKRLMCLPFSFIYLFCCWR